MNNAELTKQRVDAVPRGTSNAVPVFAARAKNAQVWDVDGKEYVDFSSGIGVLNVGHCHPKVVAAVKEQAERLSHTCWHVFMYEPYLHLAEKLNQAAPGDVPYKTMFANSGAEAVENAIKIARSYTKRKAIVVFENAFHGRTLMAMSLTSKISPYKKGFGPFAPEIYRIPYAYCYRCPVGLTYPDCGAKCAELLADAFEKYVQADDVAAVIVEPVQGEGGFIVPPPEYIPKLKAICGAHGILYVSDEIQSGMGRCGKMFAIEQYGVVPDLITTAKSLGSGYPISAVTGRADVMDAPSPGGLGGTYGGNPVACAAGLAVFDIIESEGLLERAMVVGEKVKSRFLEMQTKFPIIGDVRGLGAMVAMELVRDRETKQPAPEVTKTYRLKLFENGLANIVAGTYDNVIRCLVPLTIEDEVLERGLDICEQTLAQVMAQQG
jgi:4-aminobutyrate aminotransferase / (S)-3-amino-2-methylpropionate transaminase / 5-aminovalerate transaminase